MKAKLVCGWCGTFIEHIKTFNGKMSTGICTACLLKHFGLTPKDLYRFLHEPIPDKTQTPSISP